jgi:hypothetical protein
MPWITSQDANLVEAIAATAGAAARIATTSIGSEGKKRRPQDFCTNASEDMERSPSGWKDRMRILISLLEESQTGEVLSLSLR